MRIPVQPALKIEEYAGGGIVRVSSQIKNGVIDQYSDGTPYTTQRPGINKFEDASAESITDVQGRGVYYWDAVGKKYFVNYDTLYEDTYADASPETISTGYQRVEFFEIGDYLVIVDSENDEAYYKLNTAGTPGALTALTNGTHGIPTTFVRGGVALNGKLYLMTADADIYECDVEDPTTWNSLNSRNAEVEPDGGVYLARHLDHVIAFGTRSAEVFYDTAAATGSTLSPREDITWGVGAVDSDHVWHESDMTFFVGQAPSGGIGVYVIQNFQLSKISDTTIDSMIASAVLDDGMYLLGSGFQVGGRIFFCLTIYNLTGASSDTITSETTLVYSATGGLWSPWELAFSEISDFPLVGWTESTTTRSGEGILANGDLVTVLDDYNPQDTLEAASVYVAGVYESGVYSSTAEDGDAIAFEIITGQLDFGTRMRKFMSSLFGVYTPTSGAYTMTVSWANEQNGTFDRSGTLNTDDPASRINRLGSFRQRNFKLAFESAEQIRIEALEVEVQAGRA